MPDLGPRFWTGLVAASSQLGAVAARACEPTHVLPVLLGLAIGWQWRGAARVIAPAFEPSTWAPSTLGVVLLLCMALGPHLPEWVQGPLGMFRRKSDALGSLARSSPVREVDRARATAVLCGVAGILCLTQLALVGPYLQVYEMLLKHFFWTRLTLVLLNAVGLAVLMGAAWCVQGLVIVMLTSARGWGRPGAAEQWSSGGQTLLGFALGSAIASGWLARGMSGHQLYLMGAMPLFVMSVVCVGVRRPSIPASDPPSTLNEAPDQAGADVWLCVTSLLAWAMAAVFVVQGLLLGEERAGNPINSFSWLMLGIGIGSLGRLRGAQGPAASLSDAGLMLLGCGLAGALAFQLQLWNRWSWAGLALAGGALGYGLHRLEQASLARLGRERIACSQLITAVCAGAAVGLAVAHWWALPMLGCAGLLILGILSFLSMAGILQIYTQDRPGHVRHARLGAVFATLAAAILVFPAQAREALHRQRLADTPLHSVFDDPWLAALFTQARSTCVLAPVRPQELRHQGDRRVVFLRTGSARDVPNTGSGEMNLLTSHRRFELVYQCWPDAGSHFPQYSLEWCERLVEAAGPEGLVVLDVPRAGLSDPALEMIASTLARACGGRVAVDSVHGPFGPGLRLAAPVEAAARVRPQSSVPWNALVHSPQPGAPVHSLIRDRITSRLGWESSAPRTAALSP